MTPLFPLAVYPSQLDSLKERADTFASLISELSQTKKLSSFKRYDYLSMALGYKGHSDLVNASKFRVEADKQEGLLLFTESAIRSSIREVFTAKLPVIDSSVIDAATKKMAEVESKSRSSIPMFFYDEGVESYESTQASAKFMNDMRVASTPKNEVPVLKIDLSEMPTEIYEVFSQHPALNEIDIDVSRTDVRYSRIWHKGHVQKGKKDWKIYASFDVWGVTEISMDLIIKWNKFKDWVLKFNPTGRIQICERIKGHSMLTFHTQVHPDRTIDDLIDDLPTNTDQLLFALFMENESVCVTAGEFTFTPHEDAKLLEDHIVSFGQGLRITDSRRKKHMIDESPNTPLSIGFRKYKVNLQYELKEVLALEGKDLAMLDDKQRTVFDYYWKMGRKFGVELDVISTAPKSMLESTNSELQWFQVIERFQSEIRVKIDKENHLLSILSSD